uniref:Peroxisomal N(1)-acetyl-spermine/spermidine oxidase n=1 Tax=Lygus hesperus TaxID=30085 RepID=A0A146L738_LYGHE
MKAAINLLFSVTSMLPSNPRIVIVGGGVSGIAAAVSLVDKGFDNVTVLEAEDRVGGRVNTVPFGHSHVDLGAHWVHGEEGNAVYEIGNQLGLLTPSGDFGNIEFFADDGSEVSSFVGMSLYEASCAILDNKEEMKKASGSVENYLTPRILAVARKKIPDNRLLDAYLDWLIKFECTIEGCDYLSDPSAPGLTHYKQCPGDPITCWIRGGYKNIIDILLNEHPAALGKVNPLEGKILLNTEVKEIDWGGLTAFVKTKDGRTFQADHVIVTVSLGVLKDRHSTLFNPRLPDKKIQAIRGLGIGTVNKIYLKFEKAWWPEGCCGFSLLRKNKSAPLEVGEYPWERDIIGFYIESTAPMVVGAWLVGDAARDMETYKDEQVLAACYRTLIKFAGTKYDIPPPEAVIRSKWFSNPHFRGSYSYRSISSEVLNTSAAHLAEPVKNFYKKEMLFFAGEATHSYFYSTVHGALETGWREAERIATMYTNRKLGKCSL